MTLIVADMNELKLNFIGTFFTSPNHALDAKCNVWGRAQFVLIFQKKN